MKPKDTRSVGELAARGGSGVRPTYVFFWGIRKRFRVASIKAV